MSYKIALAGLVILLGIYSTLIEPQWLSINVKDLRLDKNLESIRIVHLADLHINKFSSREIKVANQVNTLKPDLLVLSGDSIDRKDNIPALHSFLNELDGIQAIAVLGNWEYWSGIDKDALYEEYQHHNIRLLVNEATSFHIGQRSIQVLGIDDFTAGFPNINLLQYVSKADLAILVQHSPGFFDNLPTSLNSQLFDICLSGHTHGGQVTLLGRPIWMPPGSGTFASGLYQTPVCDLYVSRGIGTSILPIRFWARPEIAAFDL